MSGNNLADRLGLSRYDASRLDVVVLVPCYNEEHAIAKVVAGFRAADGTAVAAGQLAFMSFARGLILDIVTRGRGQELNCA